MDLIGGIFSSQRPLTALLAQKDELELSQRIAELAAAGGSRHIYQTTETATIQDVIPRAGEGHCTLRRRLESVSQLMFSVL